MNLQQDLSRTDVAKPDFLAFELLGVRVQAITAAELLIIIGEAVSNKRKSVVANHNLHSLYLCHHDAKMRELYTKAAFTHIDGMALIALARMLGAPFLRQHRTTYLDFVPLLAEAAAKHGWRIYYLGGKPGVAELAAQRLSQEYRGIQIRTHHGYFDAASPENELVLADIQSFAPDILMVGMGMPRQEVWISSNLDHIRAHAILCVGCLMDYIAGEASVCPRWLSNMGFEWLHRLLNDPGRLYERYLIEPWFILGQLAASWFKVGRFTSQSAFDENQ